MPHQNCLIAPSILTADFAHLGEQVNALKQGGADLLHLDVMDGNFVPEITFGTPLISSIRQDTTLPLDVHLMVAKPENQIDTMIEAGADQITFHIEATPHSHRLLKQVQRQNKKCGIALNPATPLSAIEELIGVVDTVLIMTVNPGYSGQTLISSQLDKISRLRALLNAKQNKRTHIMADGGINQQTAAACVKAGADVLVIGSAILNAADYKQAISKIRSLIQSAP